MAIGSVAAALLAGMFDFSRALEPGRNDRNGFTLTAAVDTGDWIPGSPGAETRAVAGGGVELRAAASGTLLLVTRSLPVDPDACYVIRVRARTRTGHVTIAVYDERISRLLAQNAVPPTSGPRVHELRFEPAGRARVTFAVVNLGTQGRFFIQWLRFVRQQC